MRTSKIVIVVPIIVILLTIGCSLTGSSDGDIDLTPGIVGTDVDPNDLEPKRITGQEALELYGAIGSVEEEATRIPETWFPIQVWVTENVLPYDPDETIDVVAVFTRPELTDGGTWLGDIQAGSEVTLLSVLENGSTCFIEGTAVQGWVVKGWVACNRLSFTEVMAGDD